MSGFYDFEAKLTNGELMPMSLYKGRVVLVVNVATKCKLAPQLSALASNGAGRIRRSRYPFRARRIRRARRPRRPRRPRRSRRIRRIRRARRVCRAALAQVVRFLWR